MLYLAVTAIPGAIFILCWYRFIYILAAKTSLLTSSGAGAVADIEGPAMLSGAGAVADGEGPAMLSGAGAVANGEGSAMLSVCIGVGVTPVRETSRDVEEPVVTSDARMSWSGLSAV
jgi:hypothetical protein